MIPRRLTLRNFMSYGEEPVEVDFTGLHVICLSGDNGNGKSALLDAMTYALWGKTRVSGTRAAGETDLIRLGASEMEVRFEFSLDGVEYRSVRSRSRTSRSDWSLHSRTEGGPWVPVGGNSVRETERVLERLLRMSYDTFINSAYLAQGKADEFTRRPPAERKRILADILNLGLYDELRLAAVQKVRFHEGLISETQGELRALEAQMQGEEAVRAEREAALARVRELQPALEEARRHTESCRKRVVELEQVRVEREALSRRLADASREAATESERIQQIQRAMEKAAGLIATIPDLEREALSLKSLRERKSALAPVRQQQLALLNEQSEYERAILRQRMALENHAARLQREVELATRASADAETLQQEIARLTALAQEAQGRAQGMGALKDEHGRLQERFAVLKAEHEALKRREEELQEITDRLDQAEVALCPVCGSDLSPERRAELHRQHSEQLKQVREQLKSLVGEGRETKAAMEAAAKRMEAAEQAAREAHGLEAQIEAATQRLEELRAAASVLTETQRDLEHSRKLLAEEGYAEEERRRLLETANRLTALQASLAELASTETHIEELERMGVEARLAAATKEREQQSQRRQDIEAATVRRDAAASRSAELAKEIEGLEERLALLDQARQELAAAEERQASAQQQLEQTSTHLAVLEAKLEAIGKAHADFNERQRQLKAHQLERELHADLAQMFGKSGIQARIIENAIPDIEDEANLLLSRMTDNALQLRLKPLRETKSGSGEIDTLEIEISDQEGTRPYELFSGGEAFRANFALRIALSRLLTRRAGTALRTLILDEGFGTQDARGRERLVEAIEAVRDDFALILVITHIESLKDAFPDRLEVTKGPNGSQVTLVG